MTLRKSIRKAWLVCAIVCLSSAGCTQKASQLEPTSPEVVRPAPIIRPQLEFHPVAAPPGQQMQEAHLTTHALPQMNSRLDIRTMLVPAGKPITMVAPNEGIMEIRAGALSNVIGGQLQRMDRGQMWQVAKGESVTFQAFGELAVVRVIYLLPGK